MKLKKAIASPLTQILKQGAKTYMTKRAFS
jgi:hypothetical protein